MPAGEGGSLFGALTRRSPPVSVRGVVNTYLVRRRRGARARRDAPSQYAIDATWKLTTLLFMNLTSSYVFFVRSYKYVHLCALSGLPRARSVWSRRQDRLRVLDICSAVERAAQPRELLVVVPPARVVILRHELPHVVGELALEPEQSFS